MGRCNIIVYCFSAGARVRASGIKLSCVCEGGVGWSMRGAHVQHAYGVSIDNNNKSNTEELRPKPPTFRSNF